MLTDVWTEDGKIDVIKFSKLMASLNGTKEKDEVKNTLDFLGIKYMDLEKNAQRPEPNA